MRTTFVTLALATFTSSILANSGCKQKQNNSPNPSGNPINLPGLGSQVPVGKGYDITWTPTNKKDTVALVLLRGPSEAAEEFSCIEESLPNSGKYTWTPPTSLENDKSHYGIKIIVHGTGEYQYSTQFGIKNDQRSAKSSGKKPVTKTTIQHVQNTEKVYLTSWISASGTGKPKTSSYTIITTSTHKPSSKKPSQKPTHVPSASPSHSKNSTTVHSTVRSSSQASSHSSPPSFISSHASNRSTTHSEPKPTKPITKPSSLEPPATSVVIETGALPSQQPTATTPSQSAATATGAAVRMYAGGMLAGIGAMAALVL